MLDPSQVSDLRRSGLSDETIAELGFYSGSAEQVRAILGFEAGPGLVIPYPLVGDLSSFHRVKPDSPPVLDGKPAKYLSPKNGGLRAYIPPRTQTNLASGNSPSLFAEGEKKAAKADEEGFPCIGLGGIYGFRDREHHLLPELESIDWDGRIVYVVPDSDVATNLNVRNAVWELAWLLHRRGAEVYVVVLPAGEDGIKVGLDDYLVERGKLELQALIDSSSGFIEWAVSTVALAPTNRKGTGIKWLVPRLNSLDPIDVELVIEERARDLGLSKTELRKVIKGTQAWRPSLPKAEREETVRSAAQQKADDEAAERARQTTERETEAAAHQLLRDPSMLFLLGSILDRLGLAGEAVNSRIVYLEVTSRILSRPISGTVKGESSAGKSHLVLHVLKLFPADAYMLLTGMSRQALVYSDEPLAHRTIIVLERPGMDAADYNIRTLQSEGKIIFETVERDPATNEQRTVRKEKSGPTNFIFTTTSPEIHAENETRHWSIFIDESPEQTRRIKAKTAEGYVHAPTVSESELAVWRKAQELIEPARVVIPYASFLAEHTPDEPIRMRRDFGRLLAFIETIALLYQRQRRMEDGVVFAGLEDYYMASVLAGDTFVSSASGRSKNLDRLIQAVGSVCEGKIADGPTATVATVREIAAKVSWNDSTVRRWLKPAVDRGWLVEISEARGSRGATYAPGSSIPDESPLPFVEELAEAYPDLASDFSVVDPLSGETLTLSPEQAANVADREVAVGT